jgi:ankyrin repeat protein
MMWSPQGALLAFAARFPDAGKAGGKSLYVPGRPSNAAAHAPQLLQLAPHGKACLGSTMVFAYRRAGLAMIAAAAVTAIVPVHAADAPSCRDLERRFDLIKADATSLQLNLTLFAVADAGCLPLARRLLEAGASLEARDRLGAMPLTRAARAGHAPLAELFLARGAPIDARNLAGATALYAASENERQATVALFLAKGADPNLPGRSGISPLAAGAFKGNDRIVEQLIARAADPDIMDATGKAPITYAAARGFAQIVRRLLDAGVDPRRTYGNDLTALMWATGHEDGVGAHAAIEVSKLLLDARAPIDAIDNRGRSALMIAAERGDAAVVEFLLSRGADRSIADKSGKRAFELAASEDVRAKLRAK